MESGNVSHRMTAVSPMELAAPWMCSSSGLCFINKEAEATRKGKEAKLRISTVYLTWLIGLPFDGKGH